MYTNVDSVIVKHVKNIFINAVLQCAYKFKF